VTEARTKPIGLLGGMTPESTKVYYDELIALGRTVQRSPLDNPVVLIYSVNLAEVYELQKAGRGREVAELLSGVFERLRRAGAEIGALTANTPHVYFDEIIAGTDLPLVSILDSTFDRVRESGCRRVLLLGTRTTMAADMYPERFAASDIGVVVPSPDDQELIDNAIYNELSLGEVKDSTREAFLDICRRHIAADQIDAVILGCSEIPLLIAAADLPIEVIDTTRAHAAAIFARAR